MEKDLHDSELLLGTTKKENVKLQQQLEKVQKKEKKALKRDLRADKKEQEKKMKEDQEKRKNTMFMDMKGRTTFLEKEIAKMEEENNVSLSKLFSTKNDKFINLTFLDVETEISYCRSDFYIITQQAGCG